MKHSQQQHFNPHQRQHLDCKRDYPKITILRRKQFTSVAVARSKILSLHQVKVHKAVPSTRPLSSIANIGQILVSP
jgi:hypothetical protein